MFWELSEDAPNVNPRGLVKIAKDTMQGGLEYRQNELSYQGSSKSRGRSGRSLHPLGSADALAEYDNLRAGMPGQ